MKSTLWNHASIVLGSALFVGCQITQESAEPEEVENIASTSQAIITTCPWTSPTINFYRELLIRDLAVVEDQCRTTWDATKCSTGGFNAASQGKWTFKHLMTEMAGFNNPQEFVGRWLSLWESSQPNLNGFPAVGVRTKIRTNLIAPWIKATNGPNCGLGNENKPIYGPGSCQLDLNKAPFRLLAIVPRADSSTALNWGQPPDPNHPGELRFVFGAVNLDNLGNTMNGALQSTVIFEYRLTPAKTLYQWGSAFHELGSYAPGTQTTEATYKTKLETITGLVVKKNAISGAPNTGSALAQIRTNEIDYDGNATPALRVWEFREHKLDECSGGNNNCFLALAKVAQTADNSINRTAALDAYLTANEAAILDETNSLPATFDTFVSRSGSGAVGSINEAVRWDVSDPNNVVIDSMSRHLFGFAACNGCHYSETGIDRIHIKPRKTAAASTLSAFLGVSNAIDPLAPDSLDNKLPANIFTVDDPVTGELREYNEPWRRACELRRILAFQATPYTKASGAH